MAINLNGTTGITTTGLTSNGIDDNATSTAMTLDTSGNVLVGKTVADTTTLGNTVYAGIVSATMSGDPAIFANRAQDGSVIEIQKNGTTVGSIGIESGGLTIDGESGHSGLRFGGSDIAPRDNGVDVDAGIQLGNNIYRFTDLYLSGGVFLGGTGSSNKLDDYEEGTFSPSFNGSSSNPSVTYTSQNGIYVKIGNMVYLSMGLNWSAFSGGSGNLRLGGLPFEPNNANSMRAVGSISYSDAFTGLSNAYGLEPHTNIPSAAAGTYFYYKNATGNIANYIDTSDVKSSGSLQVCLIYRTT